MKNIKLTLALILFVFCALPILAQEISTDTLEITTKDIAPLISSQVLKGVQEQDPKQVVISALQPQHDSIAKELENLGKETKQAYYRCVNYIITSHKDYPEQAIAIAIDDLVGAIEESIKSLSEEDQDHYRNLIANALFYSTYENLIANISGLYEETSYHSVDYNTYPIETSPIAKMTKSIQIKVSDLKPLNIETIEEAINSAQQDNEKNTNNANINEENSNDEITKDVIVSELNKDIKNDPENSALYSTLLAYHNGLINDLKDKTQVEEKYFAQRLYMDIDDIAKVINKLPAKKKEYYTKIISNYNEYPFQGEKANIAYIYHEFITSYISWLNSDIDHSNIVRAPLYSTTLSVKK